MHVHLFLHVTVNDMIPIHFSIFMVVVGVIALASVSLMDNLSRNVKVFVLF